MEMVETRGFWHWIVPNGKAACWARAECRRLSALAAVFAAKVLAATAIEAMGEAVAGTSR
jgi:hypothetical protein